MRAALKIALAVAVLGAGWAAMQQDDGVELAASDQRGGRDRSRDRAGTSTSPSNGPANDTARRGERSDRPARAARAASGVALAAAPWTDAALSEGVQAWRLRAAESEALPPPRPMTKAALSAWASMAPPPPPPVKVVAAPPPPPPMAPRFPHAWIGRVNDETVSAAAAQAPAATPAASAASAAASAASAPVRVARPIQRAVLAGPVATWVVREGDVIEGQWRVDRIQDRSMSLTYLPLQQSQTVSMK